MRNVLRWGTGVCVLMCVGLGPNAFALEEEDLETLWTTASATTEWRTLGRQDRETEPNPMGRAAGVSEWRRLRRETALGLTPLGLGDLTSDEVASALLTLAADDGMDGERMLLALAADAGWIDDAVAHGWSELARTTSAGDDPTALAQRALHARALALGSAAALLPASCFPAEAAGRRALESMMAAETAGRMYRPVSFAETEVAWTDARARLVLPHLEEPTVWLALQTLRTTRALVGVPESLPTPEVAAWPAACDPTGLELILALEHADAEAFVRAAPLLRTLAETGGWPPVWSLRLGLSRYIRGDRSGLDTLQGVEARQGRWDLGAAYTLIALDALLIGWVSEAFMSTTGFADGGPFERWIWAEVQCLPHRGENGEEPNWEQARDTATSALDRDPFFAAAMLTRSAAWIGLGFRAEAHADLAFLRTAWAPLPVWGDLIEALAQAVR